MTHRTILLVTSRSIAPRRGIAELLAIIAVTILTSLAAAMAIVAQGNVRTADSHMKVSRAMSAAETGLNFAARRLAKESRRFVTKKGVIDDSYGEDLWAGELPAPPVIGSVEVLPPDGYTEGSPPDGLAQAVMHAHLADEDTVSIELGDASLPYIDGFGTLRARPIALTRDGSGLPDPIGPYFRLKYESVPGTDDKFYVRVTSRGVDGLISRTLQMDFRINKKIQFAVVGPSRIMIGKNVRVEGPLGTRYGLVSGELDSANGDPLVMRSDFYYLNVPPDTTLDDKLDVFFAAVVGYDADNDGRLRVFHPTEKNGLTGELAGADYDGNEYVDDFDLFLKHFDTNPDQRVVYDASLADIYYGGLNVEFTEDLQLARLIDRANPDRDTDGAITLSDHLLGYDDGCLDAKDAYAKVKGRLLFAVTRDQWNAANPPSYQTVVQGPIVSGINYAPVTFDATDEDLRDLSTEMLQTSQSWYEQQVPNTNTLVPGLKNEALASGGTYTAADTSVPGTWEQIPYQAQGHYDHIARPQFRNATFRDVRIPMGANALFENCFFVGVTFIETHEDCKDKDWNYCGTMSFDSGAYVQQHTTLTADLDPDNNPSINDKESDTKPFSNNIRFDDCTFIGSVAADKLEGYAHWRNKLSCTGNTRFYIDPLDPDLHGPDAQPDAATILSHIDSIDPGDRKELAKSQWYTAGWSVDVGNFHNLQDGKLNFKGCIVAGIMDVRGTADIFGTMLNTFHPVADEGPLDYGGMTDAFNATIGYFGPEDGDGEGVNRADATFSGFGEITLRYNPDALLPDGIPWFIRTDPEPGTYFEGGTM